MDRVILLTSLVVFVQGLDVWDHLGTRTPYRFVSNEDDAPLNFEGCTQKKIWQFTRHGTRYPGSSGYAEGSTLLPQFQSQILLGQGTLSNESLEEFRNWTFTMTEAMASELHIEGVHENNRLGERTLRRFSDVIPAQYSKDTVIFRSSDSSRTEDSVRAFAQGMYNNSNIMDVEFQPTEDEILRWYRHCTKYMDEVYNNPESYKEMDLYGVSAEMAATIAKIEARVGFNLTVENVDLMFSTCGFETAWNLENPTSPWCLLFDAQDAVVLEYYNDLGDYYINSYGSELAYQTACQLIKDLDAFLKDDSSLRANFLMGHAGGIQKILAFLGLFKPELHINGTTRVDDFIASTTKTSPFCTNVAFVVYNCTAGDQVAFLHQERVIPLPGCENKELCPLEELLESFREPLMNCDFDRMCENNAGTKLTILSPIAAVLVALLLTFLNEV